MTKFIIEDGIFKAYFGKDAVVVVPEGVTQLGGDISDIDRARGLFGDIIGYKAFFQNKFIKELYLPDSVTEIGFKSLEHCSNLEVLSFSSNMKTLGCNAVVGCNALKKIIFRGTIYEFSCLCFAGQTLDLEVVYCTDGQILFGKDREYYIDTLYFPGTRAEWDSKYSTNDWRNRRCKKIVCLSDTADTLDF